ncbi:MAG: hypothetical protein WBM14_07085 [Terracidiphilus sp.]
MYSFRRLALLLALLLPVTHVLLAESSSSSSNPDAQDQAQTPATPLSQGQLSVQARIKARRDQRRAQAIHDTYSHLYEAFVGGGYLRYTPGPNLQRVTLYSWDAAMTRYFSERLGVTVDGRGYYGTAYVGLNPSSITRPAISQYGVLAGPTYRLYMRPRYSVAGRVMGGVALGNFSSDTSGFGAVGLGLYPDATTYAISASVVGEANVSPNLSLRLGPEYYATGFGSTMQNSVGFTYGFVYRFGKQ